MRNVTIEKTAYQFEELTSDAQETAIDTVRGWVTDYEWHEAVYEDSKEIGKILGIDIKRIFFSGFSSQGDGACFEGYYSYKIGSVKAIKAYAPTDKDLHQIAIDLTSAQRKHFYQLSASVKHRGHYYHELCTEIDVTSGDGFSSGVNTADSIIEPLRSFMQWIYQALEAEYDYLTSDESVIETIQANGYEFTEDGDVF